MMQKKIRHKLHTRLVILFTGIGILFYSCYSEQEKADSDLVISWIGHSCYEIKYHDFRILLDPHTPEWFDYSRPKGRFDIVFATHKAADHFYFEGIEANEYLLSSGAKDEFIQQRHSKDVVIKDKTTRTKNNKSFSIWTVASFHDDQGGAAEGVNGVLCFDFGGIKVVHLGDLGHILEETHLNKIGTVDVLMIPVDGYYTIDIKTAKAIIQQLDPRIVLPMHYKTEKSSITAPIYTEKNLLEGFPSLKRIHHSHLDIDKDTLNHRQQVIILDYLDQGKSRVLREPRRQDRVFSHLEGPYLGQKPPGMIPEIFAPGILNNEEMGAFCSVFSLDGN